MIRNLKSYEDARDTAQFNGMSRKAGNQYRDSYPQYGTHQQSGHPVRDGMNYQSINPLQLGLPSQAAAAAAASVANAPPHSSHFVQGNPLQNSGVASGSSGNLHGIASHGGIPTSSQTVLPLTNQHSQGPTPASTPPAAPNDPKGVGQFTPQTYPVMFNPQYQNRVFITNPTAINQNTRMTGMRNQRIMSLYPPIHPLPNSYVSFQNSMPQNNNTVTSIGPYANQEHLNYFVTPQPNPPIQNYIQYPAYRSTCANNMRVNPSMSMPYTGTTPGIMHYNANSTTQMSQAAAPRGAKKCRSNAVKIINPETMSEVDVSDNNDTNSALTNSTEKSDENEAKNNAISEFAMEVGRRATEPSPPATTAAPSFPKKEPLASVLNGSDKSNNSSCIPPSDWKASLQANAPSDIQNVSDNVEPVVNSLKSSNSAFSTVQSTKMDYKRPTREEPPSTIGDIEPTAEVKTLERIPSTSWPESTTPAVIAQPVAAVPKLVMSTVTKKAKEPEPVLSCSIAPPSTTIPSHAPSIDGPKAPSVTSTSIVLDDNETSKKTSKQGIQGVGASEEEPTTLKQQIKLVVNAASSHPLPQVSQAPVTISAPPLAQTNVTKVEKAPPAPLSASLTTPLPASTQKPSTSALQTSGPASQKAPNVHPFPSKTNTSAVQGPVEKNAIKDEKSNPSKTKNRGKENAESNADASNAKGKTNQTSAAKHHNTETKTAAAASVVTSKQANGETEAQNAGEGKSKKNKKPNKKEVINKKGSEKEGSDMDVFTEKPSAPADKSKAAAQPNNTGANRASKTNSSQKSVDEVKEDTSSAGEPKDKLNLQNIPSTQVVPAADLYKTEQTVKESRPYKYSVEFLRTLRELSQCRKTPQIALEHLLVRQGILPSGMSRSQNGHGNFIFPHFSNVARNNSMSLPLRKSQQGRGKNDRQGAIHLSLSNVDVQLRQSKDAWKPARINPDAKPMSSEERKTQDLYKNVTGILNKLTPEKFDTLVDRIMNLPIDSHARLEGVIDLIFQKAVDEPGFCRCYAEMCSLLQQISVLDENGKSYSFRALLITKCQYQFQRDSVDELDVAKRQEEIKNCKDPEKKKELQLQFEDIERKVRRKSVGNCRFIGELFKYNMLVPKIMLSCIATLVSRTEEESLECLCRLLTTIGKILEPKVTDLAAKKELDKHFDKMRELSERKAGISSRIKFMLQDVLDLRKSGWVPRRESDNPKKIDQINTEFEKKEQEIKLLNMQPMRNNKDEFFKGRDFKRNAGRSGSQNEDEYRKNNYKMSSYKVDASKFSAATQDLESNSLGSGNIFKKWGGGVAAGTKTGDKKPLSYQFSMDKPLLSNNYRSMPSKITPTSSMEKSRPYPGSREDDGKISRSSSSQNIHPASRESSMQRQPPSRNASQSARQPSAPAMLGDEELDRACSLVYQEYLSFNNFKESIQDVEERFNPKQIEDVVRSIITYMIENKPLTGVKCGLLISNLMKRKVINKQHFMNSLQTIVDISDDLLLDCPKLWDSLADFAGTLVTEDCIQLNELKIAFPGCPFLELMDVKPASKNNGGVNDKDSILSRLVKDYLNNAAQEDDIRKWIDENFEKSRDNAKLVFELTTSICQAVYEKNQEPDDAFESMLSKFRNFFKWYIENKGELEIQCLMAVHEFVKNRQYPSGLLLKFFEFLYDKRLISYESYMQWKNCDCHGVAQMSLKTFYEYIGNPPPDDNSTAD